MLLRCWIVGALTLILGFAGCGKSDGTNAGQRGTSGEATTAQADGPEAIVGQFLEAVRSGNDAKATGLLTGLARQKMAEKDRGVTAAASDTAKFEVGAVEYLNDDGSTATTCPPNCTGARVDCKWTDLDEHGKPRTERALWVVRREAEGWRVMGVAAFVFDGEEPLLLSFEDPDAMDKKQEWLREETARRAQRENPQAQIGKNSQDSFRR